MAVNESRPMYRELILGAGDGREKEVGRDRSAIYDESNSRAASQLSGAMGTSYSEAIDRAPEERPMKYDYDADPPLVDGVAPLSAPGLPEMDPAPHGRQRAFRQPLSRQPDDVFQRPNNPAHWSP